MSKRLGRNIGCKDKKSSWHSIGFPDGSSIGSTVLCRGETYRYTTVHLHQSPCRYQTAQFCYVGFGIGLLELW